MIAIVKKTQRYSRVCCGLAAFTATVLSLSSCAVGPDFHAPAAPKTEHYTNPKTPTKTIATPGAGNAGQTQTLVLQQQIAGNWWYLFESTQVNDLVNEGLAKSPTLTSAKATLTEAQDTMQAQIGNLLFPSVDFTADAERLRTSSISLGGSQTNKIFNLYNTALPVTYNLDIWGEYRREIENLRAQVDYTYDELLAAYLSLSSNIVSTSVAIASLNDQIVATNALIADQQSMLTLMEQQYRLGAIAYSDVLTQQTTLAQTEATLPPLEQAVAQSNHSLAVLLGQLTSDQPPLKLSLANLKLPTQLPLSLPADLIKQRPDIQSSQALLHEASANIGVATANMLPSIQLTGNFGYISTSLNDFFSKQNNVWSIGGNLMQPVFHGGELWYQRKAAIAAFDAAAANYQQTVLQSFQNVADALSDIEQDAVLFNREYNAYQSAAQDLNIVQKQYKLGGVDYQTVLTAQEKYQQTNLSFIKAKAARFADTISLYQALGGGWWQNPSMKPSSYGVAHDE